MKTIDVGTIIKRDQNIRSWMDTLENHVTNQTTDEQWDQLNRQFDKAYPGYNIIGLSLQTVDGQVQITRKALERNYKVVRNVGQDQKEYEYDSEAKIWYEQGPSGVRRTTKAQAVVSSKVDCSQLPPYLCQTKVKTKEK